MNFDTLKIIDRPADEGKIKTLDVKDLDLREELKKVLNLKSTTYLESIKDPKENN